MTSMAEPLILVSYWSLSPMFAVVSPGFGMIHAYNLNSFLWMIWCPIQFSKYYLNVKCKKKRWSSFSYLITFTWWKAAFFNCAGKLFYRPKTKQGELAIIALQTNVLCSVNKQSADRFLANNARGISSLFIQWMEAHWVFNRNECSTCATCNTLCCTRDTLSSPAAHFPSL